MELRKSIRRRRRRNMKNKEEEHIKGKEKYNKTNNNLSSSYIRMLFRTTHLYVMERVG